MRFRADQHLRRPGDIRAVREQGQRLECRAFTLWWKRREAKPAETDSASSAKETASRPSSTARVCVIASTSAIGNAVRRNRAKRRLREVFRKQQQAVPLDCDLLMIARRAVIDSPLNDVEARFSEACQKIAAGKS